VARESKRALGTRRNEEKEMLKKWAQKRKGGGEATRGGYYAKGLKDRGSCIVRGTGETDVVGRKKKRKGKTCDVA